MEVMGDLVKSYFDIWVRLDQQIMLIETSSALRLGHSKHEANQKIEACIHTLRNCQYLYSEAIAGIATLDNSVPFTSWPTIGRHLAPPKAGEEK